MQLAHIGNGVSVERPSPNYMEDPASPSTIWNQHLKQQQCLQANRWHHHSHSTLDQSTTSATSSTEAGMLKPPVLPLLNGDHSPASMEAETTAMTPKPSVPPQPVRDHYPASARATTEEGMPKPSMPKHKLIGAATQHPWKQCHQP